MTEYTKIAKGNFTATATSQAIRLPFQPQFVELWNYTNIKTAASNGVCRAWWDVALTDSTANPTMIQLYPSGVTTSTVFDTIQTNGISLLPTGGFGAAQQVIGITKANPGVVNVTAHGYSVGDTVVMNGLWQSSTTGMPQIADIFFTITVVGDADHFTINWNTNQTNYTAISGSPTGSTVRKVLAPFNYVPQGNNIGFITLGATTTVSTSEYHNFEVGQEIAFRIPSGWGTVELNSLPNNITPGSPIYGYVTSITDNWTFVCNINSSSFTTFNVNQVVTAQNIGIGSAQVFSAGDVNTGGNIITSTSSLYPPPRFPTSTNRVDTINGPAIRGAYVNNTSQGFFIGPGLAAVDTSARIMASTNVIYWQAMSFDIASP